MFDRKDEETLNEECSKEVEKTVEAYLATTPALPETMMDYLYLKLPERYSHQRDVLKSLGG